MAMDRLINQSIAQKKQEGGESAVHPLVVVDRPVAIDDLIK